MLFNSLSFLVFFPCLFIIYWFVAKRHLRLQNILLLVGSYFFYGWWNWRWPIILLAVTLLDYLYGFYVASPNKKKARLFLYLSLINNIGLLAVFKYYDFFIEQVRTGLEALGLHANLPLLQLVLPVGISFYTFHGMSYVFDVYHGKQKPMRSFIDYGVFVSFFPLLVAGPIERAAHLLPQIQKPREFNYTQAVEGCRLILWGMIKKVVIADNLAPIADYAFGNYQNLDAFSIALGVLAFSFQIYGDFSGYSDIAIGTAKLLGFELLSNFRFPYFARDIADFWRRWHISLTSWFKDYLYIPMGGSRVSKIKVVRNTFVVFLVSGFWHGASWKYIIWGALHAVYFIPLLLLGKNRVHLRVPEQETRAIPKPMQFLEMLLTFSLATFAWIFFRADDFTKAIGLIKRMGENAWQYLQKLPPPPEHYRT